MSRLLLHVTNSERDYSEDLASRLGCPSVEEVMLINHYKNNEFNPRLILNEGEVDISGAEVYVHLPPGPYKNPLELIARATIVAHTAKFYGAKRTTLVARNTPFARADKKLSYDPKERDGRSVIEVEAPYVKSIAEILATSFDRMITLHLHSPNAKGLIREAFGTDQAIVDVPMAGIYAHYLINYSGLPLEEEGARIVFVAPDKGSVELMQQVLRYTFLRNASYILMNKSRKQPNLPSAIAMDIREKSNNFTSFRDKYLVMVDDMLDTGGTLMKMMRWCYNMFVGLGDGTSHNLGLPNGILPMLTHAEFAGRDYERVQQKLVENVGSLTTRMILSDSRPYIERGRTVDFRTRSSVLRINPLLAHAIETLEKTEDTKKTERHFKPTSLEDLARFGDYYELAA